jgi:hypothetical protein
MSEVPFAWGPLLLAIAVAACSATPTDPGGFVGAGSGGEGAQSGLGGSGAVASGSGSAPSGSTSHASGTGASSGGGTNGASRSSGGGGGVAGSGVAPLDGGTLASDGGTSNIATIQTVDIQVPSGSELVKCQNFKNPIGQDAALLETDSNMVSSHHMFVFHDSSFNQDTNAVADCSGIEFHDLLHLAQTPQQSIVYPAGVGRSLKAADGLRILVHLLNPGSQAATARVSIKMRWVAPSAVQSLAVAVFLNNAVLVVPTGVSTQSRTFTVPSDIKLMSAVSHMHSRATKFSATTNTGAVIYQGTSWNEPAPTQFNPNLSISQGTIITWACTYNNTTGMTLTFGESANTNEMCILAGVAYPAKAGFDLGTSLESVL